MMQFLKNKVHTVKNSISEKLTPKKSFPIKRMANLFGGALLAVTAYTHTAEATEQQAQPSAPVANHVFYHNNTLQETDGNEALLALHRVQTGGLAIDTRQMTNSGSRNGYIRRDVHTLQESGRLIAFIQDKRGKEWQLPVHKSGFAYMPPSHPAYADSVNELGRIEAQNIMVGTLENGTAHIIATAFQGTKTTTIPAMQPFSETPVSEAVANTPTESTETSTKALHTKQSSVISPLPSASPEKKISTPAKEEAPESPWFPLGAAAMASAVGAYIYKQYKKTTQVITEASNMPAFIPYVPEKHSEEEAISQEVVTLEEPQEEQVDHKEQPVEQLFQRPLRTPMQMAYDLTAEEIMDLQELYDRKKNPKIRKQLLDNLRLRFGIENTNSMDIIESILSFRGYSKVDASSMYYWRLLNTLDFASATSSERYSQVFWLHTSALDTLKERAFTEEKLLDKLLHLAETNTLPVLQKSKLLELLEIDSQTSEHHMQMAA